jgi:hypothetical protein
MYNNFVKKRVESEKCIQHTKKKLHGKHHSTDLNEDGLKLTLQQA